MASLTFEIAANDKPQKTFTKWYAKVLETGDEFFVGYTVPFSDGDGAHRGLAQTKYLSELPNLYYDRVSAAKDVGLWAHFMWPTVFAESAGGHHLLVNTYDRARFTFGFYQLAAHTPDDNLILLFRKLLELDSAPIYFPDLKLISGRVHRQDPDGTTYSLEEVTVVHRPNGKVEKQLVGFMSYLNPDTANAGHIEALNTAKLMHWLQNHPEAVQASVATAMEIMRRKAKRIASTYDLEGKQPELAVWCSDITHQGRGSAKAVKAALSASTFEAKLDALYEIGSKDPAFDGRRKLIRKCVNTLRAEKIFEGVQVGDDSLPL